jgi:hypothetical protein
VSTLERLPASPTIRLRTSLAALRAEGRPFDGAWYAALATACTPYPERSSWLEVFTATRETWRRCYQLEPPTALDEAMTALAADGFTIGAEPPPNTCELDGCERLVVRRDGRASRKIYCSFEHMRQASRERERERGPRSPERIARRAVNGSPAAAKHAPQRVPPSSGQSRPPKEAIR